LDLVAAETPAAMFPQDPAASSRALFFPPAAFAVFDGEGFILQVHGVFTRIRSGATAMALYGDTLGSTLLSTAAVRAQWRFLARSDGNGCECAR
jgi:hypothetical protein